jgi:hypothetical protein
MSQLAGVIKASPGAFSAQFQSNSHSESINKATALTAPFAYNFSDTYRVNPDNPYFFIYAGLFLVNAGTGVLSVPDIYAQVTFNFLSGGVTQSSFSPYLYGGTSASGTVNFPNVFLNYDPDAPSVAYCNAAGCAGIGGVNPPTSWAFGLRWTGVVDTITVDFKLRDASTMVASPSTYDYFNAVFQLPWG